MCWCRKYDDGHGVWYMFCTQPCNRSMSCMGEQLSRRNLAPLEFSMNPLKDTTHSLRHTIMSGEITLIQAME